MCACVIKTGFLEPQALKSNLMPWPLSWLYMRADDWLIGVLAGWLAGRACTYYMELVVRGVRHHIGAFVRSRYKTKKR